MIVSPRNPFRSSSSSNSDSRSSGSGSSRRRRSLLPTRPGNRVRIRRDHPPSVLADQTLGRSWDATRIEVATAGRRIEDGAGFVIGEGFEVLAFVQDSGRGVSWEIVRQSDHGFVGTWRTRSAFPDRRFSRSASPFRSRLASSWLMAKTPMQHWVQPSRQTSQLPLRAVVSARAASTIWISSRSLSVVLGMD